MNETVEYYIDEPTVAEGDAVVTYSIAGSYRPATRLDPEEFASLEIESIVIEGVDIIDCICDRLYNDISEYCWDASSENEMLEEDERNDI